MSICLPLSIIFGIRPVLVATNVDDFSPFDPLIMPSATRLTPGPYRNIDSTGSVKLQ